MAKLRLHLLMFCSLLLAPATAHAQQFLMTGSRNYFYSLSEDTLLHKRLAKAGITNVQVQATGDMPDTHHLFLQLNSSGKLIQEESCSPSCHGTKYRYDSKGRLLEQTEYDNGIQNNRNEERARQLTLMLQNTPAPDKVQFEQLIAELRKPPEPTSRVQYIYTAPTNRDTVLVKLGERHTRPRHDEPYTWCAYERSLSWKSADTTFTARYWPRQNVMAKCDGSNFVFQFLDKQYRVGDCIRTDKLAFTEKGKLDNFQLTYTCYSGNKLTETGNYDMQELKTRLEELYPEITQAAKPDLTRNQYHSYLNEWERQNQERIYQVASRIQFRNRNGQTFTYDKAGLVTSIRSWDGRLTQIDRHPDGRIQQWTSTEGGEVLARTTLTYGANNLPTEITQFGRGNRLRSKGKVSYPGK